jgi:hypothetical protein
MRKWGMHDIQPRADAGTDAKRWNGHLEILTIQQGGVANFFSGGEQDSL